MDQDEIDRCKAALEILQEVRAMYPRRFRSYAKFLERVKRMHALVDMDLFERALHSHLAHLKHEPLADVPALVKRQAA